MLRRLIVCSLAAASLFAAPRVAFAQQPTAPPAAKTDEPQEPKYTLSAGYQFLIDGSWDEQLRLGFAASIARRMSPIVSIVGEVSGSHGEYGTTGFSIQRYAFLGGVRLVGGEGEVRPFFQALAGYSRQGGDVGLAHGIAIQPGAGVDLVMTEWLTLRAQGDYRWIREDGENYNQYRISGGIVWHFGKLFFLK